MNGDENRPSPGSTLAVILGVSQCPRSPQLALLPGSAKSAEGFYYYLTNEFGLPEENILLLFESLKSPSSQIQEIGDWLFARRKTVRDLILFYTGHGGFTPGDRKFFLAARTTKERSEGATSIRMVDLSNELTDKAEWARKYLILDCCFAGSAACEFMASPGSVAVDKTKEVFPSKGVTILCSSSAREVSIAPLGGNYTMFSEALLEVLQNGNERVQTDLSLHDVGVQVRERIREKYLDSGTRPEIHSPDQSEGDIASVRLFPNAALKAFRVLKRQQEEQERLAAEQREKERIAAEQREKERLEAEQRQRNEQEREAAEKRQREEQDGLIKERKHIRALERLAAAHNAYYEKKDYDKAIGDYNEAIRLDPNYASAYYYRALAFKAQGKNAQAQSDFDKAKQLGYTGPQ